MRRARKKQGSLELKEKPCERLWAVLTSPEAITRKDDGMQIEKMDDHQENGDMKMDDTVDAFLGALGLDPDNTSQFLGTTKQLVRKHVW